MKYSRQRELIRDVVLENRIHPTADVVYGILRPNNPNISLATVYRNLNLLASEGIITKLTVPSGADRFDGETKEHYHMVCEDCGKVFDCPLDVLTDIDIMVENATGFDVKSHQLILYGSCEFCQKKS